MAGSVDDVREALRGLSTGEWAEFGSSAEKPDDEETVHVQNRGTEFYGENGKFDFAAPTADDMAAKLARWHYDTVDVPRSGFTR